MSGNTVVGDVIKVEHGSYDATNSEWVWTQVGRTRGEVSIDSDVNVAETTVHDKLQDEKDATSEAWMLSFEHLVQSTLGALNTLGLITSSDELKGFVNLIGDEGNPSDGDEALRVYVYEDETAVSNDTVKLGYETYDCLVVYGSNTIAEDDYSAGELEVHSRERFTVTTS